MHRLILISMGLAGILGCQSTRPEGPLHLEIAQAAGDTRLTLFAAPGLRLNARLKPALELDRGEVLRFDSPVLSPDLAYFAEAPTVLIPGHVRSVHGRLRASVCETGASICRSIVMRI